MKVFGIKEMRVSGYWVPGKRFAIRKVNERSISGGSKSTD